MSIYDRIHCDNIYMPCSRSKMISKRDEKFSISFQMAQARKNLPKNYLLNYKRDPEDKRDFLLTSSITNISESIESLPEKVDYTSGMSSIKNQGQLGSCVSFAVSAMKEWQEKREHEEEIAKGKRGRPKVYDYSEAWIYWNAKKIDPWPNEEGTSIRYAMKVLQKIGVPTEKGWPYKDVGDIGEPKKWATLVARWALIDSYWRVNNLNELKIALSDGPVPIGIPCFYEIFFVKEDGLIAYPDNPDQVYGGHAVCLSGDTNVPLLNGKKYNMRELSILYPEKKFWVYSNDNGKIVAGLAHSPRKTGTRKVLKITLDNGESYKCTYDHETLYRDNTYKEAQYMNVGDSIMPFYRKKGIGDYEMIFNPNTKEWLYTHKVMCENHINTNTKIVTHHKNFNKYDNRPTNLQDMSWGDHALLHAKYANPEPIIKYSKSKEGRNRSRELMLKNWNDNNFREKMKTIQKENGKKVANELVTENRCGFQAFTKEKMQKLGHENGLKNHIFLNSKESHQKHGKTFSKRYKEDSEFREKVSKRAQDNLREYNKKLKSGEIQLTERQIVARKNNAKNITKNLTDYEKKLRALKTTYTKWYKDKFDTFKEFLEFKEVSFNNHKVISIEECGYEDVYDLTVEKYHNFAIDAGVFVHNCAIGYNDKTQLIKIKNSWGKDWGAKGYGYLPYKYIEDFLWDAWASKDLTVTKDMLKGVKTL